MMIMKIHINARLTLHAYIKIIFLIVISSYLFTNLYTNTQCKFIPRRHLVDPSLLVEIAV